MKILIRVVSIYLKGKSGDGRVLSHSESPRRIRSVTIQRDYIHLRPLELSNLDPDI